MRLEEKLQENYWKVESGLWCPRARTVDFDYTDGAEVEDRILSILRQTEDVSSFSDKLKSAITDWPSLYHLSPNRANLLRPFTGLLKGDILEVGAGFGAITRFMAEQGGTVLALEGSQKRAQGIALRCKDLKNVFVVVDSFDLFELHHYFDVITLIGVLEYARKYFPNDPYEDGIQKLLKKVASFLKPNGVLILAIENQLGLKYFCGSPEDHYGIPFLGINDAYPLDNVVTFGRKELEERLREAGYISQDWWYPFPDYKIPTAIFSSLIQNNLQYDFTPVIAHAAIYDPQKPAVPIFSLERAWSLILRNNLIPHLANSFLVIARKEPVVNREDRICCYYSTDRSKEFAKEVIFRLTPKEGAILLEKNLLFPDEKPKGLTPLSICLTQEKLEVGENWQWALIKLLNKQNWTIDDLKAWAKVWIDAVTCLINNDGGLTFGLHTTIRGDFFDAVPRNLIVTRQGEKKFIDQKWRLSLDIEFGYLLFRGLFLSLLTVSSVEPPLIGTPTNVFRLFKLLAQELGYWITPADFSRYLQMESDIQSWALGREIQYDLETYKQINLNVRLELTDLGTAQTKLIKLSDHLAERERELAGLRDQLSQREQVLQDLNNKLLEIYSSTAWKIIQWMWRVRLWLFPRGSWRERVAKLFFSFFVRAEKTVTEPHLNEIASDHTNIIKVDGSNIKVSIVIPVYNAFEHTRDCISSIYKFSDGITYEVILVDNGSSDDTPKWARRAISKYPNFRYLRFEENLGFGPSVNQGIKASKGEVIVILNNDTLVTPGWLCNLVKHLENDQSIGIISPITNYVGEGLQVDPEAKDLPAETESLIEFAKKISRRDDLIFESNRLVFFCVAIRREVIDKIGVLDEGYEKGNFEDDDYCLRARLAGYKLAIAKNAFVYHKGSVTFKENKIDHGRWMESNRHRFYLKSGRIATSLPSKIRVVDLEENLISVITRTKDRPHLLSRALTSLANQTYRNFEVIVVNDGDIDVEEIINRFRLFYSIKYYRNKISVGRTEAMNIGLHLASGEWIAFLDDDDILYPWHFESLIHATRFHKDFSVFYSDFNYSLFTSSNDKVPIKIKGGPIWEFNLNELLVSNHIPVHTYMFLRNCIGIVGVWDTNLDRLEDYEFLVRLGLAVGPFHHVRKVTAEYRIYLDLENSVTGEGRSKYLEALKMIYKKYPEVDQSTRVAREEEIANLKSQIDKMHEITMHYKGLEARSRIIKLIFGL